MSLNLKKQMLFDSSLMSEVYISFSKQKNIRNFYTIVTFEQGSITELNSARFFLMAEISKGEFRC